MNTNELIECYVVDVAVLLPRKLRNDVAFELRALLNEELQAKADAEGRSADPAMVIDLLRAFGRPADVAARYRPTLTIVDPADGHRFLRIGAIGLAVIAGLGLLLHLWHAADSGVSLLVALGPWWVETVNTSLWWLGLLVAGFGTSAWVRRRWPRASVWTPLAEDRIHGGRAMLVLGAVAALCGIAVLIEPRWILDAFWGGRAAPAAYEALTYTDTFRHRQGPLLLALLLVNIPMWAGVLASGRWSRGMRRLETVLTLVLCAVMLWTVVDGPVFLAQASDAMTKFILALIVALTLLYIVVKHFRGVRPTPNRQLQS